MYNETQLQAFRLFGDKTLSEGCIINTRGYIHKIGNDSGYVGIEGELRQLAGDCGFYKYNGDYEILGHEPHLSPDLFRVAEEKGFHYIDITHLADGTHELCFAWTGETDDECIPYNPTLPLLSQQHLSEIVNLFSTP